MTRPEAALLVRERWERLLGMSPEEAPHVFSSDVDNMLEDLSTGNILDVADRATGNAPVTDGLQVGDGGGGEILSSSPLYLLASEIVDKVTKGYEQ